MLIKRTADNRIYDIICTNLLDSGDLIIETPAPPVVTSDGNIFTFPSPPIINTSPVTYPSIPGPNGTSLVAAPGTVIQIRIAGGVIPVGLQFIDVIVRALFFTTTSPTQLEATFIIRLQDLIG
jgi:hypothetical protein